MTRANPLKKEKESVAKAEERALVPLEELSVDFYGDEVITVIVDVDGKELVYIPIRPICEYLGLSPNGQRERIQRNRILSKKSQDHSGCSIKSLSVESHLVQSSLKNR